MTDSSVTPNVWRSTVRHLESELRDVQADDLIVLFVSGHGLVDEATDQYYFVTANASYSDLVRQNYRDCLSFQRADELGGYPLPKDRHPGYVPQRCNPTA